jgi:hypothetical protein
VARAVGRFLFLRGSRLFGFLGHSDLLTRKDTPSPTDIQGQDIDFIAIFYSFEVNLAFRGTEGQLAGLAAYSIG